MCQKLSNVLEIWRSFDKTKLGHFWHTLYSGHMFKSGKVLKPAFDVSRRRFYAAFCLRGV